VGQLARSLHIRRELDDVEWFEDHRVDYGRIEVLEHRAFRGFGEHERMIAMRFMRVLSLLMMTLAAAGSEPLGGATPPFELTLALVPDKVLPGLPVKFRVTVTNQSNAPVDVPQDLRLQVEPVGAEPFFARVLDRDHSPSPPTFASWPESLSMLGSKQAATVVFPNDPLLLGGPEWFRDPRLNKPGVYRLRLLLYPAKVDVHVNDSAEEGESLSNVDEPIVSNSATLTIRVPEAEDAAVWEKMQELGGPAGWNSTMLLTSGIAEYVLTQRPASRYLPYFVHLSRDLSPTEKLRQFRAAIAMEPGPQSDDVRLALAFYLARLAKETTDLAQAYAYADLAREEYRKLLAEAKTPEGRRQAERGFSAVPNRAEIEAFHEYGKKRQK
jgi:hypothetical protein